MITQADVVALALRDPDVTTLRGFITIDAQVFACRLACEPISGDPESGEIIDATVTGFVIGFWLGRQSAGAPWPS